MQALELRPAAPGDALEVAQLHCASWRATYRGIVPDAYLDAMDVEDRARRYDFASPDPSAPATVLGVNWGGIVGFVTTSASRDPDGAGLGEICALYLHPEHVGRGSGAALLRAGLRALLAVGFTEATLWVLPENHRARRFYERQGFVADGTAKVFTLAGAEIPELRYRGSLLEA